MRSAAAFLLIPALFAQAPVEPKDLRWRAEAHLAQPAEFAVIEVRREIYARSESEFNDLRIYGPDGAELGWHLEPLARRQSEERSQFISFGELRDVVQTPAGALRFTITVTAPLTPHHAIQLQIHEKYDEFQRRILVETSQDGRTWDAAARGGIFRSRSSYQNFSVTRIGYPPATRRFMRVTVDDWTDPAALTGVEVFGNRAPQVEWDTLGRVERPERLSEEDLASTGPRKAALWEVRFDYPFLESARVSVETETPRFARNVSVQTSADGQYWADSGSALLYRVLESEHLTIPASRLHPRRVRLRSVPGADAPLEIGAVRLEAPVRRILFPARTAGRYTFHLGRPDTRIPDYDLPAVLARSGTLEPAPVALGEWIANPDYVPPPEPEKPVSERFPWLLPSVLALAVVGMGSAAWQLLRKAG